MTTVMKIDDITLEYPLPRNYRKKNIQPSGIRNITLEVKTGEVIGVVGRNGSGKSTLLKLMAGVFPPDSGMISMRGTVSLLSGVGVGFHKDLTGRENSYLYGALMGRSQNQIDDLIDDIQSFAELEHHFDRPLRTYSSGMKSRLGISVATAFRPDLLLIDEVLGVGDASFREKSQRKVKELIAESGSVVIVSHSMGFLKSICTSLAVIDKGALIHYGDVKEGLKVYSGILNDKGKETEHDKDSGEKPDRVSSFRSCIQQSIDAWRSNPDHPRSRLISKLNKKIPMKLFMEKHSSVHSNILGKYNHISEVNFEELPDLFVIKPQDGASNNGVFLLKRKENGLYYDSMRRETYTTDGIIAEYLDEHERFKSIHLPVYVEERFLSANPHYEIPLDYKGYCFDGKVSIIMQRDVGKGRKSTEWKFAYYTRDWERLDEIRTGINYSDDLVPPKEGMEIVQEMERLASLLPLKFCSMDMYNTQHGVAFGECTIHPGAYKAFVPKWNEKLGQLYEHAPDHSEEKILQFLGENKDIFP